jgi:hypothetical protein
LHRCRSDGLRFDKEGFTLDPDERLNLLKRLIRYAGDAEMYAFVIAYCTSINPIDMHKNRIWQHVYLARYMRLSPSEIERMPLSLIRQYIATLSEFIKKEAGPAQQAETDFV